MPALSVVGRRSGSAAAGAADSSRRLTCWKRLPRRLQITARAALWSRLRVCGETSSSRSMNTAPRRTLLPDGRCAWLAPNHRLQSGLQDPERKKGDFRSKSPGRPPIASSASIRGREVTGVRFPDPGISDSNQNDRQVPGDAMRPERRWPTLALFQHCGRRPQRRGWSTAHDQPGVGIGWPRRNRCRDGKAELALGSTPG